MTERIVILVLAAALDLVMGDPHWLYHPVRAIGALIAGLEKLLRRIFPDTEKGLRWAGRLLVVLVLSISTGLTILLLRLAGAVAPWLGFALEVVICCQCLAARSLRDETMKVYRALKEQDLEKARHAVSMVVSRDTQNLDEAGVARAAVETVAENESDGVTAPLLFLALGGAPLGILYKAANTMDSMVGYQNDRYLHFGRCAAKVDDLVNYVPSRLSGLLMCLLAPLVGLDGKNAWRIFRRDRLKHKSPNAAQTEAAVAGALHIQLNGPLWYFGKLVVKPALGDADRPVEAEDIPRSNRLMFATAAACLAVCCALLALL